MSKVWLYLTILCLGISCYKVPATNFYLLSTKLKPDYLEKDQEKNKNQFSLRVKPAFASNIYNRNNLVYRKTMFKIGFYNYHKWAVKPEKMVTDIVYDFMVRAGTFRSVSRSYSVKRSDYEFHTNISRIEQDLIDNKEPKASIKGSFLLVHSKDLKTVVEIPFERIEPLKDKSPEVFVAKLSSVFAQELSAASKKIDNYFSRKKLQEN